LACYPNLGIPLKISTQISKRSIVEDLVGPSPLFNPCLLIKFLEPNLDSLEEFLALQALQSLLMTLYCQYLHSCYGHLCSIKSHNSYWSQQHHLHYCFQRNVTSFIDCSIVPDQKFYIVQAIAELASSIA